MDEQNQSFPLTFEKGLSEQVEDSMLPNGFAAVLENWVPEPGGGVRARRPWTSSVTTGAPASRRSRGIGYLSSTGAGGGTASVFVGSFDRAVATGAQSVTGVGFVPKAIIFFWGALGTATGFATHHISGIGLTSGPTESYAVSASSDNGTGTPNANRWMAAKAISSQNVLGGSVPRFEASLTSFDADGFTLDWTTAPAGADRINYIAIGGAGVEQAQVLKWNTQASTGTQAITGVGFRPDLVLSAYPGGGFGTTVPADGTQAILSLGAMDSSGNQWVNGFAARDFSSFATARFQRTDAAFGRVNGVTPSIDALAAFSSMDADGFTYNWSIAETAAAAMSLCLKGPSFKVGSFNKDTGAAPDAQAVTGVGFTPKGLLLSTVGAASSSSAAAHALWGLGAVSAAGAEKSVAIRDDDDNGTTDVQSYQHNFPLSILDTSTASTLDSQLDFTSFDADGFTGSWTTNDATAAEILYLAIGDGPASIGVDKVIVANDDASAEYDLYQISRNELASGSWTAIESLAEASRTDLISFAEGLGGVMYTNKELATIRRWDGSAAAAVAGSPPGRCVAFHKSRFFAGGTSANPSRLWWSDLGSYATWGASSYIEFSENDGDAIHDIAVFEDGLLIAKQYSLHFLSGSGPDTFTTHPLNAGGGYPGRCIASTPYGAVIAGERQVWLWAGGGVDLISRPIEDSYHLSGDFVTTAYIHGVCYICDQDSGTVYCLDMAEGKWWTEKTASASTEGSAVISSRQDKLLYGPKMASTTSLVAYRQEPGTTRGRDGSLSETFKVWTPEMWPEGPQRVLDPIALHIKFRQRGGTTGNTGISIIPIYDGAVQTTLTLAAQAAAGTYRVTIPCNSGVRGARSCQFKFEQTVGSSESSVMDIEEVIFEYKPGPSRNA